MEIKMVSTRQNAVPSQRTFVFSSMQVYRQMFAHAVSFPRNSILSNSNSNSNTFEL